MFEDLSLAQLVAAADRIPDHRSPKEREKYARRTRKAQAELGEAIAQFELDSALVELAALASDL